MHPGSISPTAIYSMAYLPQVLLGIIFIIIIATTIITFKQNSKNNKDRYVRVDSIRLLRVRDLLIANKTDEAYNELFAAASSGDPYAPWKVWEAAAATVSEDTKVT